MPLMYQVGKCDCRRPAVFPEELVEILDEAPLPGLDELIHVRGG